MKKIVLASLTLLAFVISCKKYDEGPSLSLQTKKKRLVGKWEVSSYTRNEQDFFATPTYYYTSTGNCSQGGTYSYTYSPRNTAMLFDFTENGDVKYEIQTDKKKINYSASRDSCKAIFYDGYEIQKWAGKWAFLYDKEKLELKVRTVGSITEYPFEWKIIKLTHEEIKMERLEDDYYLSKITLKRL